jgi:hypothetical protein
MLRAFLQFSYYIFKGAWSLLDCARRTSTFLSCAFREQEDGQATLHTRSYSARTNCGS